MKRLPFAGRVLPLAGILACLAACLVLLFGFLYVAEAATSYRELRLESPSSVS